MTQAAPDLRISSTASLQLRAVVLPRSGGLVRGIDGGMRVAKGGWYGHLLRGGDALDVTVAAAIGCPKCGKSFYLSHNEKVAAYLRKMTGGLPVPVTHAINHLGLVKTMSGGDVECPHHCGFHREVYLDRWNKTKPLYAIAYVDGAHGKVLVDYCHAIDRKEARTHFGHRPTCRILAIGPAVGFFVDERTGRVTAD